MKQLVKSLLRRIGLLKAGRVAYSFVKGASLTTLRTELQSRATRTSGIPIPPQRLIFYVIGYRWAKVFLESGKTIVSAMLDQLDAAGVRIQEAATVLDFGCGCGRMIRHLPAATNAKLYGCDYNEDLIRWDKDHLTLAEFQRNSLAPPLPYRDSFFDLIYARSVFTHMTEQLQVKWMEELRRVLKPGGTLYFTTHGRQFLDKLSEEDRRTVESGGIVVLEATHEGHNVCASFELEPYVRSALAAGFEVLAYVPGVNEAHLQQDAYILRKF